MSGYASDPDHPDFHAVRHRLLVDEWEAHPEHDRLVQLQGEGWLTATRDDPADPDWLEWILYSPDLHDGREPIRIFSIEKSKLEQLERDQNARYTEHDADDDE
jgi:hypothetical protein